MLILSHSDETPVWILLDFSQLYIFQWPFWSVSSPEIHTHHIFPVKTKADGAAAAVTVRYILPQIHF